jgi:lysophospholipase L1-like esterase
MFFSLVATFRLYQDSAYTAYMPSFEGKRVLIIGDSLSDGTGGNPGTYGVPPSPSTTPGQFLADQLKAHGAASVRIQSKLGRSAYTFLKAQNGAAIIAKEISDHRPDVVIIMLGTNDALLGVKPTRAAFKTIKAAFDAAGIPVYHVGPPSFAPSVSRCIQKDSEGACTKTITMNAGAANIVAIGQDLFGPRFVDARPLTTDILTGAQGRAGDGIHFKGDGARKVADRLADSLLGLPTTAQTTIPLRRGISPGPMMLGAVAIVGALAAAVVVLRTS